MFCKNLGDGTSIEIITELISPELLRRVAELIIEKHVYYFQNFYDWAFWKKNGSARRYPR